MGENMIAKHLNEEDVPVMGRGRMWHRSTISKVLRSHAAIGTLVPGRMDYSSGKRCRRLEDPISDAFPAVVSKADWEVVRALKDGKASAVRGRGAKAKLANLFAGLARCPECGATMTRVMKGSGSRGGKPKLVCVKAKAGAADHGYRSITLSDLQATVEANWQALLIDIPAGPAGGDADEDIANLQAVISVTTDAMEDAAEAQRRKPSHAATARMRGLEAELASYRADLEALQHESALADHGLIAARAERFGDTMESEDGIDLAKANAGLRSLFEGVTVDYLTGFLRFHWRQGGETSLMYGWVD